MNAAGLAPAVRRTGLLGKLVGAFCMPVLVVKDGIRPAACVHVCECVLCVLSVCLCERVCAEMCAYVCVCVYMCIRVSAFAAYTNQYAILSPLPSFTPIHAHKYTHAHTRVNTHAYLQRGHHIRAY